MGHGENFVLFESDARVSLGEHTVYVQSRCFSVEGNRAIFIQWIKTGRDSMRKGIHVILGLKCIAKSVSLYAGRGDSYYHVEHISERFPLRW